MAGKVPYQQSNTRAGWRPAAARAAVVRAGSNRHRRVPLSRPRRRPGNSPQSVRCAPRPATAPGSNRPPNKTRTPGKADMTGLWPSIYGCFPASSDHPGAASLPMSPQARKKPLLRLLQPIRLYPMEPVGPDISARYRNSCHLGNGLRGELDATGPPRNTENLFQLLGTQAPS